MLNTAQPFTFRFSKGGNDTTIVVAWPTDQQWIARNRAARNVMKQLSGGRTMSLPSQQDAVDKADLALFRAILREPKTMEEVDEDLALRVIEVLDRGSVEEVEPDGDGYVVVLKVLGAIGIQPVATKHFLRAPTIRQERRWKNDYSAVVTGQAGRYEIRTNMAFAGQMYDELRMQAPEGYEEGSPVPIAHKSAAVTRLFATVLAGEETEVDGEIEGF